MVTDRKIGTKWSDEKSRLILPIGERNKHHSFRGVLFSDSKPFIAHPQICSAILMRAVQGDDPP